MVEKCVMGRWLCCTAYCKGWVGTGKHPRSSRGKVAPHLGLLDGPESWWLHEIRQGLRLAEEKAGNRRNDMRSIESMAGIDTLATNTAMNCTKIHPEQRNDLRELLCGCVWTQKRGSLIAKMESLLCALFEVRNLKMKSIFSGGAQGGRCFVVRSKPHTTWIARRPPCVVSFWKTLSQSLGETWDRVHDHIRSVATLCQRASFRMRDS